MNVTGRLERDLGEALTRIAELEAEIREHDAVLLDAIGARAAAEARLATVISLCDKPWEEVGDMGAYLLGEVRAAATGETP